MRRFRFVGDTEDGWLLPVKRGQIYFDNYFFGRGGSLISEPLNELDWQEVFDEPKPIHKDTDLGHFAGLFVASLTNDPASLKQQSEIACEYRSKWAIAQAKELIKQLDSLHDTSPNHNE